MEAVTHVLFDLDGTLLVGGEAVDGAAEVVEGARAAGVAVGVVTNDPMHSRAEQSARLARAGLEVPADAIVTSGRALAGLCAEHLPGARVLALGSPQFAAECVAHGLTPVDEPSQADAVLMAGARDVGYDDLARGVRAVLLGGARLYGSSRDATYPGAGGPLPGAGALVAALEHSTGTRATCAGKPERGMFDEARRALGDGVYLVCGDRLDSDIAGGAAAGMATALVLTGSSRRGDLESWDGAQPDLVLDGPGSLLEHLRRAA